MSPWSCYCILAGLAAISASAALHCSDAANVRPVCVALRRFHDPATLPDLLDAVKEFGAVVRRDAEDWVAWEHLGAALGMAARRLLNSPDAANAARGAETLTRAADAFRRSARLRLGFEARPRGVAAPYPQAEFAQPWAAVLRGWGDALAWTGRAEAAAAVWRLGVQRGVWRHPFCRAADERPTRPYPAGLAGASSPHPFVWGGLAPFRQALAPVDFERDVVPTLREEWVAAGAPTDGVPWIDETAGLHSGRTWTQLPLVVNGAPQPGACARFPRTCDLLMRVPAVRVANGQAKLSRLRNATRIRPHAGPVNTRLRVHCAIALPPSALVAEAWLRVGTANVTWRPGNCFVFDESCEHEVAFRLLPPPPSARASDGASMDRIVLIVDFANPFLADVADYVAAHIPSVATEAAEVFRRMHAGAVSSDEL